MATPKVPARRSARNCKAQAGTTINNASRASTFSSSLLADAIRANKARFAPDRAIAYNARVLGKYPAEATIFGLEVLDRTLHPEPIAPDWTYYSLAFLVTDEVKPGQTVLVLTASGRLELGKWQGPDVMLPIGSTDPLCGGFTLLGSAVCESSGL